RLSLLRHADLYRGQALARPLRQGSDAASGEDLTDVVIASEAKQSSISRDALDCFVATLLAMTTVVKRSIPIDRRAVDRHRAARRQRHEIDGERVIGRARIIRCDLVAADADMAVPMAERNVIGLGRHDLVITDQPAGPEIGRAIRHRCVMAMRDRDLPEAAPRLWTGERRAVAIIAMRIAPDFE